MICAVFGACTGSADEQKQESGVQEESVKASQNCEIEKIRLQMESSKK